MKKLSKILLSICMAFCLTFSLVACGDDDSDSYTPPDGVDMTSISEYGKWLIDNSDKKASFVATIFSSDSEETETTKLIKYKYEDDVQCIAIYDENVHLIEYVEISEVTSSGYEVKEYDPSTNEYTATICNKDEVKQHRANCYLPNYVIMNIWQIELNKGLEIGADITTIEEYSELVSTSSVKNPSTGKYTLSRTLSGTMFGESAEMTSTAIVEYDKVTSFKMVSSSGDESTSFECSYEYKDVEFTVNTAGYTQKI